MFKRNKLNGKETNGLVPWKFADFISNMHTDLLRRNLWYQRDWRGLQSPWIQCSIYVWWRVCRCCLPDSPCPNSNPLAYFFRLDVDCISQARAVLVSLSWWATHFHVITASTLAFYLDWLALEHRRMILAVAFYLCDKTNWLIKKNVHKSNQTEWKVMFDWQRGKSNGKIYMLCVAAYQMLAMDRVIQFAIDQRVAKILHKRLVLIPRQFRSTCLRWSYLRLMAYSIYIFHQFSVCVWSQFWRFILLKIVSTEEKLNKFKIDENNFPSIWCDVNQFCNDSL